MNPNPIPAEDIEKNRQMAALGYLWIFSFIILVARRDSAFVQLHARQGFVLFVLSILLWPWAVTQYAEILVLALMALGFIQAATGNAYRIPVIGDFAEGHFASPELKKVWHYVKHGAIKAFKHEYVIPPFINELPAPAKPDAPASELLHRVEEDEKKIAALDREVKTLQTKLL